jgi:hypothetical protein
MACMAPGCVNHHLLALCYAANSVRRPGLSYQGGPDGEMQIQCTLAELNIVPLGPENHGSIAWTPNNKVQLFGSVHIVNLISQPQP